MYCSRLKTHPLAVESNRKKHQQQKKHDKHDDKHQR